MSEARRRQLLSFELWQVFFLGAGKRIQSGALTNTQHASEHRASLQLDTLLGSRGVIGDGLPGMASAAAAIRGQESSADGGVGSGAYSRANSEPPVVFVSAGRQETVNSGSGTALQAFGNGKSAPPGVSWGQGISVAAGSGSGGDDDRVVPRTIVDVIAEAMRENGVQHHRQRKSSSSAAREQPPQLVESLCDNSRTAVGNRRAVSAHSLRADRSRDQRVIFADSADLQAGACAAAEKPPATEAAGFDLLTVGIAPGEQRAGGVVARAMAEAILDESYMATASTAAAGRDTSSAVTRPLLSVAAELEIGVVPCNTKISPLRVGTTQLLSLSTPSGGATPAVLPAVLNKQDVGGTQAAAVHAADAAFLEDPAIGACTPSGESGGVAAASLPQSAAIAVAMVGPPEIAAPFGHAVIIEEHVKATAEEVLDESAGHVSDTAGIISSQSAIVTSVAASDGGPGGALRPTADSRMEEGSPPAQKSEAVLSRFFYSNGRRRPEGTPGGSGGTTDDAGGGADGFLVLSGDVRGLEETPLPDLTGARLAAAVGDERNECTDSQASCPDSSPPEEYILLQQREGGDEAETRARKNVGSSVTTEGEAGAVVYAARRGGTVKTHEDARRCVKSGLFGSSGGAKFAESAALECDEGSRSSPAKGFGFAEQSETEFDGWPPFVPGTGLPEELGGWGNVNASDCCTTDDCFRGKSVNGTGAGITSATGGGAGVDVDGNWPQGKGESTSHDYAGVVDEETGPDPGLFVLGDPDGEEYNGVDSFDAFPGKRSLYITGGGDGSVGADDSGGSDADEDFGDGEEVEEEEAFKRGGDVGYGVDGVDEVGGDDREEYDDHTGDGVFNYQEAHEEGGEDLAFENSWDEFDGVVDDGILHGHGRGGLPDPQLVDLPSQAEDEGGSVVDAATSAGVGALDGTGVGNVGGHGAGLDDEYLGDSSAGAGGGVCGAESSNDGGGLSSCEGRPGTRGLNRLFLSGISNVCHNLLRNSWWDGLCTGQRSFP